jgi:hypothetical protein
MFCIFSTYSLTAFKIIKLTLTFIFDLLSVANVPFDLFHECANLLLVSRLHLSFIGLSSGLYLGLLYKHTLFEIIQVLLLLESQGIYKATMVFPELRQIRHELLV